MINVVGKRKIFLGVAAVMVAVALISIFYFGFKEGIDFSGGTLWQVKFDKEIAQEEMVNILKNNGVEGVVINKSGDGSYLLRFKSISEEEHKKISSVLEEKEGSFKELSFQSIGPSVGKELKTKAVFGVVFVLLAISIYVSLAFLKVSYPIKSWKYGVVALLCLFHDVVIPAGVLAWLGEYKGVEIDTNFVVALLVIAGFSVHDTIVVFDRIREKLGLARGREQLSVVINDSVNETMARSINTSLTLAIMLLALYFAGPINLQYFVLTILIGTIIGTYSSIFVASPFLVVWHNLSKRVHPVK